MHKTLLLSLLIVLVLAIVLPGETFATKPGKTDTVAATTAYVDLCPGITTFDLVAGQTNDVGDVSITKTADGGFTVDISVTKAGYYMTNAEVTWATTEAGLPHSAGGLIPGKFKHKYANLVYSDHVTFTIPASELSGINTGSTILVAVHAGISYGGLDTYEILQASVTGSTTFTIVNPSADNNAYLGVTINGVTYHGWCVDTQRQTETAPREYKFSMYLSTDNVPAGLVDNPENLPIINWIINQNYVGKTSGDGTAYTYSDVQMAIWYFIDDDTSTLGLETGARPG